jgi:hypothetical protein
MNGFPRIATDRTCFSSRDDDYIVMAEKNFAPALDNADIVLNENSRRRKHHLQEQELIKMPAGSYEYFPAVNVDETGAINVCYYSTEKQH